MDTLVTFVVASLVTFFCLRGYLATLAKRSAAAPAPPVTPVPSATIECPRCRKTISAESAFCHSCGVPMSLWNLHRAAVQIPTPDVVPSAEAKPRPVINTTLCIGCGSCVDACPETGTLALVGGKAILSHPERCVGHAKCVEVCPTSALSLAHGNVLQTLRAPLVKETFETNVSGIYIAGELSGLGLIKTAINEGRMAIDSIKRHLEAEEGWAPPVVNHDFRLLPSQAPTPEEPFDVTIVGAGPAGLSASLAAQQNGLRYLTLEQGEVAATIRNYPRHKFLMAEPVEMPLYGNLYVGDGTKESLVTVWEAILANTGVQVRTNEGVETIVREGRVFRVRTGKGVYQTKNVVLALGKRGIPRRLGIPGEELSKVTYRLIEAETYHDKDILVVGGGDSALEAVLALSKASRNRVTLSYRGSVFSRARDRNRKMLDDAERQGRLKIVRESRLTRILPHCVQLVSPDRTFEISNHYVFVLIGGESPERLLRKIGVEIVEKVLGAEEAYASLA